MSIVELCRAARAPNRVIEKLGCSIQWQKTYVAADKTFCIYLAESEAVIRKHADMAGIPVTRITEVPQVIDPLLPHFSLSRSRSCTPRVTPDP